MKNKFLYILLLYSSACFAQNTKHDMQMLEKSFDKNYHPQKTVTTIKNKNILALPLTGAMYIYQKYISGQLGASCLYYPTCSHFSKQCIEKHGWVKGLSLTADRLSRCSRLTELDFNEGMEWKDGKIIDLPEYYK